MICDKKEWRRRRGSDNLDLHIRNVDKTLCPCPKDKLPPTELVRNEKMREKPKPIQSERRYYEQNKSYSGSEIIHQVS
jgi:hypothetical protein